MDDAVDTQSLRYARGLMPAEGLPLPYGKRLVQAFAPAPERALIAGPCPNLPRLPISAGEHRAIVKAIASGNAPAAGRAMYAHVMESKERTVTNHLRRNNTPVGVNAHGRSPGRQRTKLQTA